MDVNFSHDSPAQPPECWEYRHAPPHPALSYKLLGQSYGKAINLKPHILPSADSHLERGEGRRGISNIKKTKIQVRQAVEIAVFNLIWKGRIAIKKITTKINMFPNTKLPRNKIEEGPRS